MAEKREIVIERVEQILDAYWLWAHCQVCQHSARLDAHALVERHGPGLLIDTVRERARCSACRSRTVAVYMISPGANGTRGHNSEPET